jgi:hypothetical protein
VLLAGFGQPIGDWIPAWSGRFIALWLIMALAGSVIQWTLRPKPADKPS